MVGKPSNDVDLSRSRPSWSGMLAAILAALLCLSAFRFLRIEVGSLLVHPFHVGLALTLLFGVGVSGIGRVPRHILSALALFGLMFALATLSRPSGLAIFVKVVASMATLIAASSLIRNDADVKAASLGLLIAVSVISVRGLLDGGLAESQGINPMEGIANKNAFSLYTLAPLLLGGHAVLFQLRRMSSKIVFGATILVVGFAMLSTGNRSGWIGLGLIIVMLAIPAVRRVRQVLVVAAFVVGLSFVVGEFGNHLVIQKRLERTTDGYHSDDYRIELIRRGIVVGLRNPVIGVGPQRVPLEMARLDGVRTLVVTTHNVFTLLFAGGGVLVSGSMMLLFVFCFVDPKFWGYQQLSTSGKAAHQLLRFMLVLWAVRGFFSDEILYSPAFSFGLGATIGWARLRGAWRAPARRIAHFDGNRGHTGRAWT